MLLEFPANIYQLKSFWLVMSLVIGLLIGCFLNILFSPIWFALGMFIAFCIAMPGLIRPRIATIPYRAFNILVRIFIRYANEWILLVCFFVVYTAGGKKGSFKKLDRPHESESLWIPRYQDSSGIYGTNNVVVITESTHSSWFFTFVRWAIKSGNWWMFCLLPYMILIAVFKKEKLQTTISENIYTLY
jgi:hypothetical protein